MYGDIIQFRKNAFMVEGKIPSSIMKEPDIANSIIYKESDIVYVIDTGATTFFGEKLIEAIEKLRPFRKLILFNSHCHPDHVGNNSIIMKIAADEKEHYISKTGIAGLDATKDFYRKFKNIEQYYDYLNGPSKFPATIIRVLKLTRLKDEDTPLYILVKNTLKKFQPLETSIETITPLEKNIPVNMKIGETQWKGWKFNDQVFVLQAQGHSPDEVVFFMPAIKTLILADETFEFFNCWPDSDSDNVKAVLNKSIQLFKSKEAEILISGHTHTVMKNEEAVRFLETLLKEYAEFTRQVLLAAKSNPLGLTIEQIYKKLKSKRNSPAIEKFFNIEFPKMPPFLKTVITSILLENGFRTDGKYRKKRFRSNNL
ncbi:MAG: MBL fold metallo-hydrolase [Clostridiaceae bacterium]|nr:MBL fold metallo-hydrolase [Clostridiaceae bacterium]